MTSSSRRRCAVLLAGSFIGAPAVSALAVAGSSAKVRSIAIPGKPALVAAGPRGVYVESIDDSIRRVDPTRMRILATARLPEQRHGFAVAGGAVWVALGRYPDGKTGKLARLDALSLKMTESVPLPAVAIAVTPGRSGLWVSLTSKRVVRVDPTTMRVTAATPTGVTTGWLTTGAGSVWASSPDDEAITRIDEATAKVRATIHLPDQPGPVVFSRGSLWVFTGGNRLVRISPATNTPTGSVNLPCPEFSGGEDSPVALTSSGTSLWVPGHGYLARVDAVTSKVTGVVTLGGEELVPLGGAAVRSRSVWVTDILDDTLHRVPFGAVTHRPAPC